MTATPLVVMQLASFVQFTFDGGGVCDELEDRLRALVERHTELPPETRFDVRFSKRDGEDGAVLSLNVSPPKSPASVEEHQVNGCDEGYNFVRFYLDVWTEPLPEDNPSPSRKRQSPVPAREAERAGLAVESVGLSAFVAGSTNYPTAPGYGAGLELSVALEELVLAAGATSMASARLEASRSDAATYTLERADWQLLGCLPLPRVAAWAMPCLGGGLTRLEIPAEELAPNADNEANSWKLGAGVNLSVPITGGVQLRAAVFGLYAVNDVTLTDLGVDRFTPEPFEVNVRVGLAYDLAFKTDASSNRPGSAAQHRENTSW